VGFTTCVIAEETKIRSMQSDQQLVYIYDQVSDQFKDCSLSVEDFASPLETGHMIHVTNQLKSSKLGSGLINYFGMSLIFKLMSSFPSLTT
jgi:hypothetical protein